MRNVAGRAYEPFAHLPPRSLDTLISSDTVVGDWGAAPDVSGVDPPILAGEPEHRATLFSVHCFPLRISAQDSGAPSDRDAPGDELTRFRSQGMHSRGSRPMRVRVAAIGCRWNGSSESACRSLVPSDPAYAAYC
jgi:hypothetical protein